MFGQRLSHATAWIVALALLGLVPSGLISSAAPATDVSGNTYTSPQFGYTVTWDSSWFVVAETSEGQVLEVL